MTQISSPTRCGRRLKWGWLAGLTLTFSLPLLIVHGAVDTFLKLNGIDGESVDKSHPKEIEVLAWNWSASTSVSISGGMLTAGELSFNDLSVTKTVDKASPKLLEYMTQGTVIPDGKITVVKPGFSPPAQYFEFAMTNMLVTSVALSGDSVADSVAETVTFAGAVISETYFITDSSGETTDQVSVTYDIASGQGTDTAPTISAITNTSTPEDTAKLVSFTVDDAETAAGALTLTRGSDNQAVVPTANIVLGGSGASRNITITPAPNASGSATITLVVTDGNNRTATTSFVLTVNAVNDAPTIAAVTAQTTNYGVPIDVNVTLADPDSDVNTVTLSASSSPGGILASVTDLTGTGSVRTLRLTPVSGASGTTSVTLTASDGTASSQTAFSFTVNPALSPSAITLAGNGAATTVPLAENTATDTSLGALVALDGNGITHTFTLLDDAGGRFKIGGTSGNELLVADGSLLNFEAGSSYVVQVRATDTANAARTRTDSFTINLGNVNEAPAISTPVSTTVAPESDKDFFGIAITDVDPGSANVPFVITFSVAHGTLTLDTSGPLNGKVTGNNSGTLSVTALLSELNGVLAATGLRYRGATNFVGTETLTISANDQGSSGSGPPQTTVVNAGFQVAHTPLSLWQSTRFSAAERANPAISGPGADPDGDGIPNLAEYGIGAEPRVAHSGSPAAIEPLILPVLNETYLAIRFTRRISDPGLSILVEVATNVSNWTSGETATVEETVTPIDANFERVTIRSTVPTSVQRSQQMRVRFNLD
jgi:type VI protein secretion system component Hcp